MKDINHQNKIINEINHLIDSNISEGFISDVSTFLIRGLPGLLTKKAVEGLLDSGEEERDRVMIDIKKKKKDKDNDDLSKKEQEEIDDELAKMNAKLDEIASKIGVLQNSRQKGLKYKKVVIHFNGKTELDIEKLKSPEFQRNLLGTMYFKVVGINEKKKYIDLKTTSFPNTIIIRLEYEKLITHREQSGDVHLLYNRHGFVGDKDVAGDEKKITFKFLDLEE